ncbi:hypothetical protein GOP47_0017379 [Adiantum capillus-veneris]|uniref:non-specific serine/threonine protein kinase n=1 Tax=Adiantum capillus-veneris TaxID=13818 RepID=A0A9D4ZBP9_ADICA|nr:hypothetical protein GOP47_0017379 [Adiantum capillus-veneris]
MSATTRQTTSVLVADLYVLLLPLDSHLFSLNGAHDLAPRLRLRKPRHRVVLYVVHCRRARVLPQAWQYHCCPSTWHKVLGVVTFFASVHVFLVPHRTTYLPLTLQAGNRLLRVEKANRHMSVVSPKQRAREESSDGNLRSSELVHNCMHSVLAAEFYSEPNFLVANLLHCVVRIKHNQLNDDVLGLIVLKADLVDPTNALRSWSEDDNSPCNWTGIACDSQNGRVVTVQLHELSLSGHIGRGLEKLSYLQTLSLANNNITGSIPLELSQLQQLRKLDLSHNVLSGSIFPALGNLTALKSLDLSGNVLSEAIPEELFAKCESLHYLSLASNFLQGTIPDSLGSCTSLRVLNLSFNSLTNAVPASLQALTELSSMDLSHNSLSGPLPTFQLYMVDVRLQNNEFSGPIPADIGDSALLEYVDLSNNFLTGTLPSWLQSLTSLNELNLSFNILYGQIPSTIASCEKMEYLNASHNLFSGNIPVFHGGSALVVLDMSYNQLAGNIPSSIGNAEELSVLLLNDNKLSGSIPPEVANCSFLTDINLSENYLLGSIPPEFGNLTNLEALDLSNNNISGVIPMELGQLQKLVLFNVSYNQLEGPVPDDGNFIKFNKSAFIGNINLCGANVEVSCPNVMPKPIVLNPNSSDANPIEPVNPLGAARGHKHIVLSASAILAIAAAAAISAGVIVVLILNVYSQSLSRSSDAPILESYSPSAGSDVPSGKLVMFSKSSDPRAEEWVTSAHALLNKDSELGRGGFGTVYKAVLADGRTVAIKKLMVSSLAKSQYDFEKEIQFLGQIKHRNLLALQGYYWTPQLQLLIYDFIPNGNLYSRLHEKSRVEAPLSWPTRFKIALGTARGLAHLHHSCHPQIIHYNMKSSNVLLDEGCSPKIADFGLANLLPMLDRYLMSSKFQSALGYMAPEFACQSSRINEKCDVYGYGIMLLELVTGRRPVEYMEDDVVILCDYVRSLLDEGNPMICIDANLHDYVDEEVLPVIKLGLICTSQVPSNRPSMTEVVQILELIKTPGNSEDLL